MRNPETAAKFGGNLRRVRLAEGLSQHELQLLFGCTHGFIGQLESGRRDPSLLTVIRIAGCLHTTVDELVAEACPPRPRRFTPAFEVRGLTREEVGASIGAAVGRLRKEAGMSEAELATRANISASTVRALKPRGRPPVIPRLGVVTDITAALGFRLSRLTAGVVYVPARELAIEGPTHVLRGSGEMGLFVVPTTEDPKKGGSRTDLCRSAS